MDYTKIKVALVHDYLIKLGGAEKVLDVLHQMFPSAPVYTLLCDEHATNNHYAQWDIRTSWMMKLPQKFKRIDYWRTLMPQAIESFDLSAYDLVISDSSSFAKGVITQPNCLHISYVHTPTRFLWFDIERHISRGKFFGVVKKIIPYVLHRMRQWDFIAARRPDVLIANSVTTQDRISKFYRLGSTVIYPPVELNRFNISKKKPQDYFLIISRLEPHKDLEIAIESSMTHDMPLVIVGTGTHEAVLKRLAGNSIKFVGNVDDAERDRLLYGAKALIAPQIEDFGITLVEALATGTPVIARAMGGALEIVQSPKIGVLLKEMTVENLSEILTNFDQSHYDSQLCVSIAKQFSQDIFMKQMFKMIELNLATKD